MLLINRIATSGMESRDAQNEENGIFTTVIYRDESRRDFSIAARGSSATPRGRQNPE